MSNTTTCVTDLDCSIRGTVCYGTGNSSFCDCVTLYGWDGPDCSGFSGKYSIFVIVDALAWAYAVFTIYRIYATIRPLQEKKLRAWFFRWGGMTTLWILLCLAGYFTAFLIFLLFLGLEVLNEDKFDKIANGVVPGYQKQSEFTAYTVGAFAIQIVFLILSVLNLSVHWTELSIKQGGVASSKRFGVEKSDWVRILALVAGIVGFTLVIIFFSRRDFFALVQMSVVTASLLYVALVVSGIWYRKSLRRRLVSLSTAGGNTPQEISALVSTTLLRIIPWGIGIIVGLGVLSSILSGDVKEQSPPGKISPVTWAVHFVALCTFVTSVYTFSYISQILTNQVEAMKVIAPSTRQSSRTL